MDQDGSIPAGPRADRCEWNFGAPINARKYTSTLLKEAPCHSTYNDRLGVHLVEIYPCFWDVFFIGPPGGLKISQFSF